VNRLYSDREVNADADVIFKAKQHLNTAAEVRVCLILVVGCTHTASAMSTKAPQKRMSFRRPTRRLNPNPIGAASSISLKQHESMVIEHTMFGDALGAHGDYTQGLFYGGRRMFLKDDLKLKPPPQFMTVKQMRSQIRYEKEDNPFIGLTKLEFTKKAPHSESDGRPRGDNETHYETSKRPGAVAKPKSTTVTIERFPSVNPAEWDEVKQAGCTFYIHKGTGEHSPEKPWEVIMTESSPMCGSSLVSVNDSFMDSFEECMEEGLEYIEEEDELHSPCVEEQWGCGSLAYDGKDVSELLQYLDGVPWSDEKTPRTPRRK
jgi:hypothetical protein